MALGGPCGGLCGGGAAWRGMDDMAKLARIWHMWLKRYDALPLLSGMGLSCGTSGLRDWMSSNSQRALANSPCAVYSLPSS